MTVRDLASVVACLPADALVNIASDTLQAAHTGHVIDPARTVVVIVRSGLSPADRVLRMLVRVEPRYGHLPVACLGRRIVGVRTVLPPRTASDGTARGGYAHVVLSERTETADPDPEAYEARTAVAEAVVARVQVAYAAGGARAAAATLLQLSPVLVARGSLQADYGIGHPPVELSFYVHDGRVVTHAYATHLCALYYGHLDTGWVYRNTTEISDGAVCARIHEDEASIDRRIVAIARAHHRAQRAAGCRPADAWPSLLGPLPRVAAAAVPPGWTRRAPASHDTAQDPRGSGGGQGADCEPPRKRRRRCHGTDDAPKPIPFLLPRDPT
jgi:hypothetical protein